jgi:class 3 adenylate cyclase
VRPVRVERRLSAILAADVAGYSRLMHDAEEATHARLSALLTEAVHPAIAEHGSNSSIARLIASSLSRAWTEKGKALGALAAQAENTPAGLDHVPRPFHGGLDRRGFQRIRVRQAITFTNGPNGPLRRQGAPALRPQPP